MFKIEFYVPGSHLDAVRKATYQAGAGRIGNYDCCSWAVEGCGEFRPLEGSDPFSGRIGKLERCPEWKVEMVCADPCIEQVIGALKKTHPYETPAFQYWKVQG